MGSILVRLEVNEGANANDLHGKLRRRFFVTEPHDRGQFEVAVTFAQDLEAARQRVADAAYKFDPDWDALIRFIDA